MFAVLESSTVLSLSPPLLVAVVGVVALAGVVNGLAGFGFALVGTMGLATVIDPATAVVFMIVPVLAANVTLAGELSRADLRSCGRRFGPLVASALVGTLVGMAVLERLPAAPLSVGLGVLSLAFVATAQERVAVPGLDRAREGCFVETPAAMAAVGGLSGLVFGATNVGVTLVAYLRSCDLSHGLFVGVAAMVFLGVNGLRVGAATVLGLYPDPAVAGLSVAAAVPAVAGVAAGSRLRDRVTDARRRAVVLGLLAIIGVRLVLGGLGVA